MKSEFTTLPSARNQSRRDTASNNRTLMSSTLLGAINRGRVLQSLYDLGPSSRSRLAEAIGVNRATLTGIVQSLIDEGVLSTLDPLPSTSSGGKPATPLWFADSAPPICAVVLMHDCVRTALVSMAGVVSGERCVPIDARAHDPARIINQVLAQIALTLSDTSLPVLGIGVAVGGIVDTQTGTVVKINLVPSLNGYALEMRLSGHFSLPVCIDHHPEALMLGDLWFGKGRNLNSFATIYTGEVLGCAFYLQGRRYRGGAGAGGELGHTIVQMDGKRCRCGQRGCWETVAALPWLRAQAKQARLPGARQMTSPALMRLVNEGHEAAVDVMQNYARNLAIGIANLEQVLAVGTYVLHGDVARGGVALRECIAGHVRRLTFDHPGSELQFELGEEEVQTTLKGAAGLVLSMQLHHIA